MSYSLRDIMLPCCCCRFWTLLILHFVRVAVIFVNEAGIVRVLLSVLKSDISYVRIRFFCSWQIWQGSSSSLITQDRQIWVRHHIMHNRPLSAGCWLLLPECMYVRVVHDDVHGEIEREVERELRQTKRTQQSVSQCTLKKSTKPTKKDDRCFGQRESVVHISCWHT